MKTQTINADSSSSICIGVFAAVLSLLLLLPLLLVLLLIDPLLLLLLLVLKGSIWLKRLIWFNQSMQSIDPELLQYVHAFSVC